MNSERVKTLKSRIPVPVAVKNKSLNVNNNERNLKPASRVKISNSVNPVKSHPLEKVPQSFPQSYKGTNNISEKRTESKEVVQPSLRTNVKLNKSSIKTYPLKTNAKNLYVKSKNPSSKIELKPNINKGKNLQLVNSIVCKQKDLAPWKNNLKPNNHLSVLTTDCTSESNASGNLPAKYANEKENKAPPELSITTMPYSGSKENSHLEGCIAAHKDIKFEVNEMNRRLILSGKDLLPNSCNLYPGFRYSSIQSRRPSIYTSLEIPLDPSRQAKESSLLLSLKKYPKTVQHTKHLQSPYKDRNSFYTPGANPKEEVFKSLEELRRKQLKKSALKSTKKVTFQECTSSISCNSQQKSFNSCDNHLTQINEKSEENTPKSFSDESHQVSSPEIIKENTASSKLVETDKGKSYQTGKINTSEICEKLRIPADVNNPVVLNTSSEKLSSVQREVVFNMPKKTDPLNLTPDVMCNIQNTYDASILKQQTIDFRTLQLKNLNSENKEISHTRVYTPRPISFYSQSKLMDSSSPELPAKGPTEALLKFAPICTPLVLRSVAKNSVLSPVTDLSPVRLRLEFTEKDSPKNRTFKHVGQVPLFNIATSKYKLDQLADEECSFWLLNENFPVVCGRHLKDPVALILSEGDESHFIPVQF